MRIAARNNELEAMDNISNTDLESRLYCETQRGMERLRCKCCENLSSALTLSCRKFQCCDSVASAADSFKSNSVNFAHSYAHSCPIHLRYFGAHSSALSLRRFCIFLLLCSFVSTAYGCGPGRGIGGPRRNRKLTPLVFKQHVPNMSEKTLGASGLNEGVIHRDSPKFKDLVPNYNKDIIFKDEEGTGADRLMTRRCKEKLNTLAVSVMNQWPGVRLRVTESWDEEHFHEAQSLHYEGRAVDITTSDRDRSKYGMLARLAVEAGFDWVYYESRAHIHCSVKSDASHIPHMNGCFTPESTVLTDRGERKKMKDIVIGDRVLSMTESGDSVFSEVILFMDRNLEQAMEFVQLRTESGKTLTVTPSHLIIAWKKAQGIMDYIFADRIEEGDFLFVENASDQLVPERVVELRAVLRKGVVAPLTMKGTIIVDSVAASCYAVINSQSLAHWSLAPMRLMATLKSWLPQSFSKENSIQKSKNHPKISLGAEQAKTNISTGLTSTAHAQNGVHWYTKALFNLKDYIVPKEWRYQ